MGRSPSNLDIKSPETTAQCSKKYSWKEGAKIVKPKETKLHGLAPVNKQTTLVTHRMTHKIAHQGMPEEFALKMPLNTRNGRLKDAVKLDTKPA